MTRTQYNFAAALLAASLILSLSVYGLSDGEDEAESQAVAVDEIDVEEIQRQVESALESVQWEEISQQLTDVRGILDDIDPQAIRAVAVTGMGMDGLPVDEQGRWLYPMISWHDPRTGPQHQW